MSNFYDAVAYMYEDNYGAALDYWKKAEDKDPDNPNVWYNMGVCYKNSSKDRYLAVDYLTKSLDYADPNYVVNDHTVRTCPIDCFMELGVALRMVGKYDESLAMLERAKEVYSTNGRSEKVKAVEEEIVTTNNAKKMMAQKSCNRIDVTNMGDESKGFIIKDASIPKGTKAFAFKPVIAITETLDDGSEAVRYYIASSEDSGKFNISSKKAIRYIYKEKQGISNTSLKYYGRDTKIAAAPVAEEAPVDPGRTDIVPEVSKEIQGMSDEDMLNELAENMAAGYARLGLVDEQGQPYSANSVKQMFLNTGAQREDLENAIATIRKACRENGVLVLDAEGNPTMGC